MGWLFNRKKKVEYVYGKINAIQIDTRLANPRDLDKDRRAKMNNREEMGDWPYGFYIGYIPHIAEKTEGAKDCYSENEKLFEDIRFDIIDSFTKNLPCFVYLYQGYSPCSSIMLDVLELEEESLIYSNYHEEYIGVKSFTKKLFADVIECADRCNYDDPYLISFPLLTKEEIENDKYCDEDYADIKDCYMTIRLEFAVGGIDFQYNPNIKGFREEEIFERIREVVEDKYHLQLVINR